jgi:ribosomal silencing factor RsfS
VVCTAGSARQINALKDHIEAALSGQGCAVWHTEGSASFDVDSGRSRERPGDHGGRSGEQRRKAASRGGTSSPFNHGPQWVLMDCGEIVVHLLDQHARTFYRLEDLWADAPRLSLSPHSG